MIILLKISRVIISFEFKEEFLLEWGVNKSFHLQKV